MVEIIIIALIGWVLSKVAQSNKATRKARGDYARGRAAPTTEELVSMMRQNATSRGADADIPEGESALPVRSSYEGTTYPPQRADALQRHASIADYQPLQSNMSVLTSNYTEETHPQQAHQVPVVEIPGLNLKIDGDALVQGVIFSEILTRKPGRRTR